jgi:glucose-1-phosphate cytidylyltransferase
MKVVILAGGYGTRISEETGVKPKPMVTIGDQPLLWHIMKIYSVHGFNEFIICLGYKGEVIKEYFANYFLNHSNITFDFTDHNKLIYNEVCAEPWKVTLVGTGLETMTGGRIKRILPYIGNETFMLTYGDGVGDVDIKELVSFHKSHGKIATVTAVRPDIRFGILSIEDRSNVVSSFAEKPKSEQYWVNGGFFVLQPEIANYLEDDATVFERKPLETLANEGNLFSYQHTGFWHPVDKLSDKKYLEGLWESNRAPWKIW